MLCSREWFFFTKADYISVWGHAGIVFRATHTSCEHTHTHTHTHTFTHVPNACRRQIIPVDFHALYWGLVGWRCRKAEWPQLESIRGSLGSDRASRGKVGINCLRRHTIRSPSDPSSCSCLSTLFSIFYRECVFGFLSWLPSHSLPSGHTTLDILPPYKSRYVERAGWQLPL